MGNNGKPPVEKLRTRWEDNSDRCIRGNWLRELETGRNGEDLRNFVAETIKENRCVFSRQQ